MEHSLLNSFMSGPWFTIIVLSFIAIGGVIAVIGAITRDDDDECECRKHRKDSKYSSNGTRRRLDSLRGSLNSRYSGDSANPNSSNWNSSNWD